jgi:hypothetical protein
MVQTTPGRHRGKILPDDLPLLDSFAAASGLSREPLVGF